MRTRSHYLENELTLQDVQTKTIDLKGLDPISALDIIYEATNGATSNTGKPLHKAVTKIEVVDGSDVLWSLSGAQAAALNFFERKLYPWHDIREGASAVQKEKFIVHFGRFIGDRDFYLNPSAFKNPQLKLTHTIPISATVGFATGTGKLTAIAHLFDESPPASKGFFMSKDHYDFTTVASGDETIELPTDYPYRMLMVRGYESGTAWGTDITKVKLGLNEDKIVLFDLDDEDLETLNEEWFGWATINQLLLRADNATPETFLGYPRNAICNSHADFDIANVEGFTADLATLQVILLSAVPAIAKDATARSIRLTTLGAAPHNCLAYPFGRMEDIDTWLNAPDFETIKLKITQGGAGAEASVVLQQLRR